MKPLIYTLAIFAVSFVILSGFMAKPQKIQSTLNTPSSIANCRQVSPRNPVIKNVYLLIKEPKNKTLLTLFSYQIIFLAFTFILIQSIKNQ